MRAHYRAKYGETSEAYRACTGGKMLTFEPHVMEAVLERLIPEYGAPGNPCDMTAQVLSTPQHLNECFEALMADSQYGALVTTELPLPKDCDPWLDGRFASARLSG